MLEVCFNQYAFWIFRKNRNDASFYILDFVALFLMLYSAVKKSYQML